MFLSINFTPKKYTIIADIFALILVYLYIAITLFLVYYNINKGTENKLIKKESEDLNYEKNTVRIIYGM